MRKNLALIFIVVAFAVGAVGGFAAGSAYTTQRILSAQDRVHDVFDQINSGLGP